jgi:hypothetical protein
MIPKSKPIKMLFKKGKIKHTIHAKVAMNSVNKIPGKVCFEIMLQL